MTRVDFYLLGQNAEARERMACRLTEKVWRLGHRVFLHVADPPAAQALDDLLWVFADGSFVPHGLHDSGAASDEHPVLIGHGEPPADWNDVLINLAPEVPQWFSRFTRVAELVGAAETDKAHGRDRFRFYRERGYPLETHNL